MHCDGKCHLKKQLNNEDKKDQSNNSQREKSEIQFLSERKQPYFHPSELASNNTFFNYSTIHCILLTKSVFHPPQA
jgi:hypothetical protein